jgi:hypothetical protein
MRHLVIWTISVWAVASVLLSLWSLNFHDRAAATLGAWAVGAGLGALVCIYACVGYAGAFTECTRSRIRTRGLLGIRECSWTSVRGITPLSSGVVRISTSHGVSFWLGAPVDSGLMRDPNFASKVLQIMDYWTSATERPAGTLI